MHKASLTMSSSELTEAGCQQAAAMLAGTDLQAAWQLLQQLAGEHPPHFLVQRLLGATLQQAGHTDEALQAYLNAATLAPDDGQSHIGAANCLQLRGELDRALHHYREALHCQCIQLLLAPPVAVHSTFEYRSAEAKLWQVLAKLAAAGVHAFPSSGTLLGLVRDGHLLPFDKDLDLGLPFAEMEQAERCLTGAGWKPIVTMQGLVNPREWRDADGLSLDLCGFLPDPANNVLIGGFWFQSASHPWSRITEFPELRLETVERPEGQVWQLAEPELLLRAFYGEVWRVPDPNFDTVIAAANMRGMSVLTQCYALSRIYTHWLRQRFDKASALVGHCLRHFPEDQLLLQAAALLQAQISKAGVSS